MQTSCAALTEIGPSSFDSIEGRTQLLEQLLAAAAGDAAVLQIAVELLILWDQFIDHTAAEAMTTWRRDVLGANHHWQQ